LFDLRSAVAIGNYQSATHIAEGFHPENEVEQIEKNVLLYRSHAELGEFNIVFEDIKTNSPLPLLAVRLYAEYLAKRVNNILETLEAWRNKGAFEDPTVQVIACLIYSKEEVRDLSFSCLVPPRSLEAHSLIIHHYLTINRSDLAIRELSRMKEIQDDAIHTQISRSWVNIESREKCEDALLTFQELIDKYGQSVLLLNGLACAAMHQELYEKAEKCLLDGLLLDKNSIATKINLYVCSSLLGKSKDKLTREFNQIVQLAPNHPWVKKQLQAEQDFEKMAQIACK